MFDIYWTSSTVSDCLGKIEIKPFEEFLWWQRKTSFKRNLLKILDAHRPLFWVHEDISEHLYLSTTKIWSNCSRLPYLFLWLCIHLYLLVSWQVSSDQSLILSTFDTWYLTFDIWKLENLNICTFEHLNIWIFEHWNIGTLEHWNIGTLKHWNIGTLEHLTFNQHQSASCDINCIDTV